jgi:hypothetical protein
MFDAGFPHGWRYYDRSCDVAELNDDVIDIVAEHGRRIVSPITSVALWQMGGVVARIGENETAFNGRRAGFTFNINGNTETADGFDAERDWARAYWSALAPYHTSAYVNFLMDEGAERIRQAYGAAKYNRLKTLKRTYDPENFFRLNQNIRPPSGSSTRRAPGGAPAVRLVPVPAGGSAFGTFSAPPCCYRWCAQRLPRACGDTSYSSESSGIVSGLAPSWRRPISSKKPQNLPG